MKQHRQIFPSAFFAATLRPRFFILLIALAPLLTAKPADLQPHTPFKKPLGTRAPASRPARELSYLSRNGNFMIHYDTSGYHAVPPDYTCTDSVPDYVYCSAEYLEDAFAVLQDSLGFRPPPEDATAAPQIDVYFTSYFDNYGMTYLESRTASDAWTSYMTLSTNLGDSSVYYTPGLEGLMVTCAHELFHVFQLGYVYREADYFYFEMSSVWFEEYMYPEVNDYHAYFDQYASGWDYAIDHASLYYNNVGFNLYIDARYSVPGNNIIYAVWEEILSKSALDALATVLGNAGSSFADALCNWGSAQVLCYPYAADNFAWPFDDAAELPTISFSRYPDNIIPSLSAELNISPAPRADYYKITNLPPDGVVIDIGLSEGISANLICLDAVQSMVYTIGNDPYVIDTDRYEECILVVGSDHDDASVRIDLTPAPDDLISALYPNPVSPEVPLRAEYVLTEEREQLSAALYDLRGQRVQYLELPEPYRRQGFHTLELDVSTRGLASGIYIFTLRTDAKVMSKKITLIK